MMGHEQMILWLFTQFQLNYVSLSNKILNEGGMFKSSGIHLNDKFLDSF